MRVTGKKVVRQSEKLEETVQAQGQTSNFSTPSLALSTAPKVSGLGMTAHAPLEVEKKMSEAWARGHHRLLLPGYPEVQRLLAVL